MKHDDHKRKNAERILKQAGYSAKIGKYAKGGAIPKSDEPEDETIGHNMSAEQNAEGGFVHGGMPKRRLDKISRQTAKGDANTSMPFPTGKEKFAKGGKVKGKGKTQVNVIIGHGGAPQAPAGGPPPAMMPPPNAPMPPRPMMPPPGAGGPPPMGPGAPGPGAPLPPGAGMPMRAKGGKVPKMEFGGGGGKGRLEKIALYGPKKKK